MISLDNVSYRYPGGTEALSGVSATLGCGIHLLLGENGAGKSTLLHIMAGLLTPTQGCCLFDGVEVNLRLPSVLSSFFLLGDEMKFPAATINEFSRIHAPFFPHFSREALTEALEAFGMSGDEPLARMSFGTRKKAQIAYALSLRVSVLLLDEPANGLDIDSRRTFRRLMSQFVSPEQTVIVSTHSVSELGPLYDGVIMLRRSRLILAASTAFLLERLTFEAASMPPEDALYVQSELGLWRSVSANTAGEILTDIDYSLLYSALMSPQGERILDILNS